MGGLEELREVFRGEASDSLDELSRLLEDLPEAPTERAERLSAAMRIVHNVKGAARIAGLGSIETLAHAMEDGLSEARDRTEPPEPAFLRQLGRAITAILQLVDGRGSDDALLALAQEMGAEAAPASAPGPAAREPRSMRETVRVEAARLDRLMGFSGELFTLHRRMSMWEDRLRVLQDELQSLRAGATPEMRKALGDVSRDLEELARDESHDLQRFGYLSAELGTAMKQVRMQPVSNAVPGWRQTVAEAAQEVGKEVRLKEDVGDIELDRQILDGLRDPMMHLLRNAVGHGVEDPDVREAAGKPRMGTVRLTALTAGTMVQLEVRDDGQGIDASALRRRAVERGLLSVERAEELDDRQSLELIFGSGFSTASEVTRVSGRGVGLDVVRGRVAGLGGTCEVETRPLGGTTFRITVPASLVSSKGLLVRTARTIYAVPLAHVVRTLRVDLQTVGTAGGGAAIEQEGAEPIRLRWLASLMQEPRETDPDKIAVVLLQHGGTTLGLVVSEVLGETEFVSKRLPWTFERVPGVTGAVILGDGSVALVTDVSHLFSSADHGGEAADKSVRRPEERATHRVLVVDDSLTSRTLERNILLAAGYEVLLAVDGAEAWELLQHERIDLLISDVQMPRLDGVELTRRVRGSPRIGQLPIVLVTSMDTPDDIAAGAEAGADEYIVKGKFDQRVLLEAVARLL